MLITKQPVGSATLQAANVPVLTIVQKSETPQVKAVIELENSEAVTTIQRPIDEDQNLVRNYIRYM